MENRLNKEYIKSLIRRVNQNKRFEVLNKPLRVQLKTNVENKKVYNDAKSKGYNTTNLKKGNNIVYKKNSNNGGFYVKTPKTFEKLNQNNIIKKLNGTNAKVKNLLNNNYNSIINNVGTYIALTPVKNNSNAVYLYYGHTNPFKRTKGYGTTLRKFAMNAAKNSNMKLYQVAMNVESLVPVSNVNRTPYSGRIMKKLKARQVSVHNVPVSLRPGHSTNMWFVYP